MNDKRTIISINEGHMSVLAVRRSLGEKGVVLSGTYPLADDRLPSDVLARLARFGNADVIMVLPRRQVILKYLSLPSRNPQELYRMADLQIGQGLPFPKEDIVSKTTIGETRPDGYTHVLAAVARREGIEQCLKLAGRSNIHPGRCGISAFGIAAWYAHRFPSNTDDVVLIADADHQGAELCFCRNRKLIFARSLAFEGSARLADDMAPQVQLTLDAFQKEYPQYKVGRIITSGTGNYRGLLKEIFSQTVPAEVEDVDVQTEGQGEHSMTALLGFAWGSDPGPDLIPSAVPDAKFARAQGLAFARLGAAALFAVGMLALVLGLDLNRQTQTLEALRQKVSLIKKEAKEAKRNIGILEMVRKNMNDKVLIADIMQELYRVVPERAALTSVQLNDGLLTIQGQSKESSDVNTVQSGLMNSPFFKDVALQYANRPQRLALEYTEFRIVCRLQGRKEEQP